MKQERKIVFNAAKAGVGDLIAWKYLKEAGEEPGEPVKRTVNGQVYEFEPVNKAQKFNYQRVK